MATGSINALASYQGYEFQIDVTVWVALSLLRHHEGWEQLTVEPASEEDIQVDLRAEDPEAGLSEAQTTLDSASLEIQVKLNRSQTWTLAKLMRLLNHGTRRTPPLDALKANQHARYLLITTSTVGTELRPHQVSSVLESVGSLPPDDKLKTKLAPDPEDVAARVSILSLSTAAEHHIRDALLELRVPPTRSQACVETLKTAVRKRLLGQLPRQWSREDVLEQVQHHDGFIELPELYEPFVEPRGFEVIRKRLDQRNMLVLIGPAGAGKTLAAEVLAREHRQRNPAYEIKRDPTSLAEIAALRETAGPYLVLISDPWGKERRDADGQHWAADLRVLASLARPYLRIVVTSPLGVLANTPGVDDRVERHAVRLDQRNYNIVKRLAILRQHVDRHLEGKERDWVLEHSWEIATQLELPLSIACFVGQVRSHPEGTPLQLDQLLSESLIEAEAVRFLDELRGNLRVSDPALYVVWAVLAANLSVTVPLLERIEDAWLDANERALHLPRVFMWLQESGWWKPAASAWSVRVERLSRLGAWVEQSGPEAKHVLARFEVAVLASGEFDAMLRLHRKLAAWGVTSRTPVVEALEAHVAQLIHQLSVAADEYAFRKLVGQMSADIPSTAPEVAVVQALESVWGRGRSGGWFGQGTWTPPEWSTDKYAQVSQSAAARAVTTRWIRECLPHSRTHYPDQGLIDFLARLDWDLSGEFLGVLRRRGVDWNTAILIDGALSAISPDFAAVMAILLSRLHTEREAFEESHTSGKIRDALDQKLDRGYEDHILEGWADDVASAEHGLEHWAQRWRSAKISPWPSSPSDDPAVLEAWATALNQPDAHPEFAEINTLLRSDDGKVREAALDALGSSNLPIEDLLELVLKAVESRTLDEASSGVLALLRRQRAALARSTVAHLSVSRQVELLDASQDKHKATKRSESSASLNEIFPAAVVDLHRARHSEQAGELDADMEATLATLAAQSGPSRRWAIELLGRHAKASASMVSSLLDSEDAEDRLAGLQRVETLAADAACSAVRRAFSDESWRCREAAVRKAPHMKSCDVWNEMSVLAGDPSWPVAKAVAEVLLDSPDRATLPTVLTLVRNTNDRSGDGGFEQGPEYEVARVGARLLAKLDALPVETIEELFVAARDRSATARDPVVRGHIIKAIIDERPEDLLAPLLADDDHRWWALAILDGHPELRTRVEVTQALQFMDGDNSGVGAVLLGLLGDRARPAVEAAIRQRKYDRKHTTALALSFLRLSRPLSPIPKEQLLSWDTMIRFSFPSDKKVDRLRSSLDFVGHVLSPS